MTKLVGYLVGVISGGVIGYLIGEVIAEKVYEKELARISEPSPEFKKAVKKTISEAVEVMKERKETKIDYSKKRALEELVEPYKSEAKISIITVDEFSELKPGYAQETIHYYVDDGTYANDQDEIIIAQDILGPNAHLHFGEGSEDPDIVYIRNDSNAMVYELVKMHTSYAVAVMGEPIQESKPKAKRTRKKKDEESED